MGVKVFSILFLIVLILIPSSVMAFKTTPRDGETDFPVDGKIIIEFDYSMDITSVDWEVTPDPIYPFIPEWTNDNQILNLTPTVNLLEDKEYTITVTGDPPSTDTINASVDETFSFRTETPPTEDGDMGSWVYSILIAVLIIIAIFVIFISLNRNRHIYQVLVKHIFP